jgi:hypothetical protein
MIWRQRPWLEKLQSQIPLQMQIVPSPSELHFFSSQQSLGSVQGQGGATTASGS